MQKEHMKIFCIGIGGIGLSALARYYVHHGHTVLGSDTSESELIATLRGEGVTVSFGHEASHITDDIDMVVHTIAISDKNPEYRRAQALGIICKTYPEALGEITKEKKTIAVCGTHGKTTTTAMLYYALVSCGVRPTVIIGSLIGGVGLFAPQQSGTTPDHLKDGVRTNFIHGDSEWMIVEACEYNRSFLQLHPTHVIVTNIDNDHLDYYKDLDDIYSAFQSFVDKVPSNGYLVTHSNVVLTTIGKSIAADTINKEKIELIVPGNHNRENAQLVLALTLSLGLDIKKARLGLKEFPGTWRRLEYKGTYTGAILYDDYGHHPTEIRATLQALREKYKDGKYKLVVIFQPHLYSRTKLLRHEFTQAFSLADKILVLPIYAAREQLDESISSVDLVEDMYNGMYVETLEEVKKYIDKNYHSGSIIVTMGAGDVYHLHDILKK